MSATPRYGGHPDDWERAPCPQCGAVTEEEAGPICTASQGYDGDYHCAQPEDDVDAQGYFLRLTAGALKRMDDHFARLMAEDDASTAPSNRREE